MEQALFLYNTRSGRGNIARNIDAIRAVFAPKYDLAVEGIDFTKNPFDAHPGLRLVVVAGGDGTVNYVANRMKERNLDILIGVIPAGTANDFAGALGMDHDPVKAARQIVDGVEQRVDCGRVNGLHFVNVFSFGLFTTTSQRTPDERKHKIGKLAYIIEGIKELRTMHAFPLKIVADGEKFDFNALMVLVFNGETAGSFHLARRACIQDGLLDCLLLRHRNILLSCWAMIRFLMGGNPRSVCQLRARHIEITSTIDEPTDVDGQKGADFPLTVDCLSGALRVLCPARK